MMGSWTCILNGLMIGGKMLAEFSGGEGGTIVRDVGLDNHTIVTTDLLVAFLGTESLMAVETSLKFNMDVS